MVNRLVDTLNSLNNNNVYHDNLAINSLNYALGFLLNLAEIDHRLNQHRNRLYKLESNITNIYNYIDSLDKRDFTLTLIDPVELKNILIKIIVVIPKFLDLPIDRCTNICSFYKSFRIPPTKTLIILLIVPLYVSTIYKYTKYTTYQWSAVNFRKNIHRIVQPLLAITDDE